MTDKRKSLGRSIFKILSLAPRLYSLFRGFFLKLKIETYFTIKNIIILFMLSLILACLVIATWISLLAILFFSLLQWQWTWYIAAIFIMFLNIISLILIGIFIVKIKNRLVNSSLLQHVSQRDD